MTLTPPIDPDTVRGFLAADEGRALADAAAEYGALGPVVEIGSYCGRSALWLASGARVSGATLFTIDHHRGSEEMQPGWEHHDGATWDTDAGAIDTAPFLRATLRRAGLEDEVVCLIGRSAVIARAWARPLGLLFIDGGHGRDVAWEDWRAWGGHVARGGALAIHDVFADPADGGRPPFEIHQMALASGLYEEIRAVRSLRILRRL